MTPLMQDPFMLICRRDHPLARKRRVRWRDLEDHRIIGVSRESGNRIALENALAPANVRVGWFYEVNHLSTAFGLTETGLGASVLPRLATPRSHPSIVTKALVEPTIARTIGIVERRDGTLSPAASRFRDLLVKKWGNVPFGASAS
jgi:DNA-binding transcriptional LysR family regulator